MNEVSELASSTSFQDKYETDGNISTKLYGKRHYFNFSIKIFPFCNVRLYFKTLMLRRCLQFVQQHLHLSTKLIKQGFLKNHLALFCKSVGFSGMRGSCVKSFCHSVHITRYSIENTILLQGWPLFSHYCMSSDGLVCYIILTWLLWKSTLFHRNNIIYIWQLWCHKE